MQVRVSPDPLKYPKYPLSSGFDMTVSEFLDSPLFLEENLNI
jgi:hypothetical protein